MYRHPIRAMFVFAALLAALVLASVPAAARTTPFSFSYDGTETESPCGFPVEYDDVGTAIGRASESRFELTNAGTATYTNLANGLSVTVQYETLFKNLNQVDNGDGTISFDATAVGASTMYSASGDVLLRDHGPVTTHLTIMPTETGPLFVSAEVVFEHGAHPDFCQALTAAIGPGVTP
ncbi:MAG: hypothetical protein ACJ789_01235 [Thermomicrobiales bacterium]